MRLRGVVRRSIDNSGEEGTTGLRLPVAAAPAVASSSSSSSCSLDVRAGSVFFVAPTTMTFFFPVTEVANASSSWSSSFSFSFSPSNCCVYNGHLRRRRAGMGIGLLHRGTKAEEGGEKGGSVDDDVVGDSVGSADVVREDGLGVVKEEAVDSRVVVVEVVAVEGAPEASLWPFLVRCKSGKIKASTSPGECKGGGGVLTGQLSDIGEPWEKFTKQGKMSARGCCQNIVE